jgi:hypothetical protein
MLEGECDLLDGRLVHAALLASLMARDSSPLPAPPTAELIDFYVNVNFKLAAGHLARPAGEIWVTVMKL